MPVVDLTALGRLVAAVDPAGLPALDGRWQHAADALTRLWVGEVWQRQLDVALRQIELAVTHQNLEALSSLQLPVVGEASLLAAMRSMAAAGAASVVAEARAQGAPADPPPPLAAFRLADWARSTARRLTDTFAATLATVALRLTRPGADPAEVAVGVRAHVAAMSDAGPRLVLGGALTQAQNLGRLAVYERPPQGWRVRMYADETLDGRTCKPCEEVSGTELPTPDAAALAYGGAGYIHCEGGARCRGTMIGIWTKLDAGDAFLQLHAPAPSRPPGPVRVDLVRLHALARQARRRHAGALRAFGIRVAPAARFDPGQPRDPHTGKWIHFDGAWIAEVVHTGGGDVQIGAGDDDTVTFGFDTPGTGRAAVHLGFSASLELSDLLAQVKAVETWKVGREQSVADFAGRRDGYAKDFVGITRTGEDAFDVELATGTGGAPPETVGTMTITRAEADRMWPVVSRMAGAQKVDTPVGRAATVIEKNGDVTASLPATGGERLDLTMSWQQADDVAEAITDEVARIDEFPVDGDGNPKYGPDDLVHRTTVALDRTEIYISSFGQYDNGGYLVAESSAHDWYLRLPAKIMESIGEAFQGTSGQASTIAEE